MSKSGEEEKSKARALGEALAARDRKIAHINPSKDFLSIPMLRSILNKAPSNTYKKLIQVSKFFLLNKPPVVIKAHHGEVGFQDTLGRLRKKYPNKDPFENAFVLDCVALSLSRQNICHHYFAKFLKSFCFVSTEHLFISDLNLSYDDLKLFITQVTLSFDLSCGSLIHSDGSAVTFEDILMISPNVRSVNLCSRNSETFTFTSKYKKLLESPLKLHQVYLEGIDASTFNARAFAEIIDSSTADTMIVKLKFINETSLGALREVQISLLDSFPEESGFEVNTSREEDYCIIMGYGEFWHDDIENFV